MTNDIEMMALIDTGFVAAWLSIGTIVFGLFVYVFGGKKDYIELDEPGNYVLAFFLIIIWPLVLLFLGMYKWIQTVFKFYNWWSNK